MKEEEIIIGLNRFVAVNGSIEDFNMIRLWGSLYLNSLSTGEIKFNNKCLDQCLCLNCQLEQISNGNSKKNKL
jgi:hypothetical protein